MQEDPSVLDQASSSTEQPSSSWFSGLRARLAEFNMSDWLSQLGLGRSSPTPVRRGSGGLAMATRSPPMAGLRSRSVGPPNPGFNGISALDEDLSTPIADDGRIIQPWELPQFWLMDLEGDGRDHNDTLELQHFGPLDNLITLNQSPGKGHEFEAIHLMNPTWCDKCGDFIWGFLRQAVKCQNCNYTCHFKCHYLVTLDCRSASDSAKTVISETTYTIPHEVLAASNEPLTEVIDTPREQQNTSETVEKEEKSEEVVYVNQDPFEWPTDSFRGPRLQAMVDAYNQTITEGHPVIVHDDGVTFSGYLQIHMNFTRPINVVAGERPPSVFDVVNTGKSTAQGHRTITSFFLPRHTVKTLHVASSTTSRQMIISLLRKFKVADNPRKFALYERVHEHDDHANTYRRKMLRIADEVCPLRLALSWGSATSDRQFVLQENDTGDILWEAFEIPELENFLRILEMEEQQYLWQIKQRFNLYRHYLELELKERGEIVSMRTASSDNETNEVPDGFERLADADIFPTPNTGHLAFGDTETLKSDDVVRLKDGNQTLNSDRTVDYRSGSMKSEQGSWRHGTL